MFSVYLDSRYITQEDKDKIVEMGDSWFNLKHREIEFDRVVVNLIKNIDGCKYVGNYSIKSKFTGMDVDVMYLSSGCKTAINCYCWPDRIFDLSECGENAIEEILKLPHGNAMFTYEVSIPYEDNKIKVKKNGNMQIITWKQLDGLMDGIEERE